MLFLFPVAINLLLICLVVVYRIRTVHGRLCTTRLVHSSVVHGRLVDTTAYTAMFTAAFTARTRPLRPCTGRLHLYTDRVHSRVRLYRVMYSAVFTTRTRPCKRSRTCAHGPHTAMDTARTRHVCGDVLGRVHGTYTPSVCPCQFSVSMPVSYTHLTLPTNREV